MQWGEFISIFGHNCTKKTGASFRFKCLDSLFRKEEWLDGVKKCIKFFNDMKMVENFLLKKTNQEV